MKNALDVARYFLRRLDREAGDTISPLKLQKLLYYAQAWRLVLRERPLFSEAIEAWVSGSVVREVWDRYKAYKYHDIPQPDTENIEFLEDEIEVLEEVWESYGELSARQLRDLTHSETPWLNARNGLEPAEKSVNPIPHEDMKVYYSQFVAV